MGMQAYYRAVLVQREMESGRRSVSEYNVNSEGSSHSEAVAPGERGAAETAIGFEKRRSFWRVSFIAGRAPHRNPTGYEKNSEHTRCQAPQKSSRAGGITPVHP
jgi:hypothetical protein